MELRAPRSPRQQDGARDPGRHTPSTSWAIHHDDVAAPTFSPSSSGRVDSAHTTLGLKRRDRGRHRRLRLRLYAARSGTARLGRDAAARPARRRVRGPFVRGIPAGATKRVSDTELCQGQGDRSSPTRSIRRRRCKGRRASSASSRPSAAAFAWEDEYNRQVRAVTPATLMAAAQKYLTVDNATIAALVPARRSRATRASSRRSSTAALEAASRRGRGAAWRRRPRHRRRATRRGRAHQRAPSGARLLVKRDPSVGLVAMRVVWIGGLGRYEDARTNGVNNLLAALVTRGTRTRSGDELAHEVEAMAGSIGGFSGRNSFGLRGELWRAAGSAASSCSPTASSSRRSRRRSWRRSGARRSRRSAPKRTTSRRRPSACFSRRSIPSIPTGSIVIGTADSVAR